MTAKKETAPLIINNKNAAPLYEIQLNKSRQWIDDIDNYVGWVQIPQTEIDYPIVRYRDNEFYLDKDYEMKPSPKGAIFMDYRNIGNEFDSHTILYGHNMRDGSMFAALNNYLDYDYYTANPSISFENLYDEFTYQIISVYYVSANDYTIPFDFDQDILNNLINKSLFFDTGYSATGNEKLLTLATCNYNYDNGRMIVHAVRLSK